MDSMSSKLNEDSLLTEIIMFKAHLLNYDKVSIRIQLKALPWTLQIDVKLKKNIYKSLKTCQ